MININSYNAYKKENIYFILWQHLTLPRLSLPIVDVIAVMSVLVSCFNQGITYKCLSCSNKYKEKCQHPQEPDFMMDIQSTVRQA
jgi:hypothetical protein